MGSAVTGVWILISGLVLGEGAWRWAEWFGRRYARQGVPVVTWTLSRGLHAVTVLIPAAVAVYGSRSGWAWSEALVVLVSTAMLLTVALVDLRVRRIPNVMVLALVSWAIVRSLVTGQPSLLGGALGLLAGGAVFLLIAFVGRGAMGPGDVKLAAALGALVGYPAVWGMLLVGILTGGVVTLVLLLTRRVGRKDYTAYGPYLAFGGWLILFLQCGWNV